MTDLADSHRDHKRPLIGAFVLETLTLGMYGEPRHTLREYVQNAFDAIRAAERTKLLSARGRVDITVTAESVSIRDNGVGVSADQAWTTLTSVGASKKDRQRDAGFRGIGRLAGMAYCDQLTFRTTFSGERLLTTVRFDCKKLLTAMSPDAGGEIELAKLLDDSVTFEQQETSEEADHFFEVTLSGLSNAPKILTDGVEVRAYLAETAPVDFMPSWEHRAEIAAEYRSYFGEAIDTIDVFIKCDGEENQVYKLYGQTYQLAKGVAQLERVEFHLGEESLYWGWVGHLSETGAVTEWRTRGLRIRIRNIQVGGTEIFEKLFAEVERSYGRFSTFYVGEIYINPRSVVPNARRDGFEETENWLIIKDKLKTMVCDPLAKEAYAASKNRQSSIERVVKDITELAAKSQVLAASSRATYDQVVDLMNSAKRLRRRAASRLKVIGDLEDTIFDLDDDQKRLGGTELLEAKRRVEEVETQARMLIGQLLKGDVHIDALKERLRQEIVNELLDIVNPFVDPATYQKIRRRLLRTADPTQ